MLTPTEPPQHRPRRGVPRRPFGGRSGRVAVAALVALAFCVGLATATLRGTPITGPALQPRPARPASDFVDSIGVNVHLHYHDTAYDNFDEVVEPRLLELGVRHVRDAAFTYEAASADTLFYQRVRRLGRHGIRFNLITSIATEQSERSDLTRLGAVQRWSGGAVEAFEGANEPDLFGGDDWAERTRALQRDLWAAVHADPALHDVAVIGPSPAWEPEALGDISAWTDYGNWHPYPGGECPGCAGAARTFSGRIDAHRRPTGSDPLMVTETGYHNAVTGEHDHPPVSERAAGAYLPRLLFALFDRDVARTYLYELMDPRDDHTRSDREANFGLLRFDGSRKPAFEALRNLIAIVEDPGPAFAPSELAFSVTGETDAVRHRLLQKRDGRFLLALWQERPGYDTGARTARPDDPDARHDIAVADQRVTVTTAASVAAARLFAPGAHTRPIAGWRDTDAVTVDVPDEVVLLELTPRS